MLWIVYVFYGIAVGGILLLPFLPQRWFRHDRAETLLIVAAKKDEETAGIERLKQVVRFFREELQAVLGMMVAALIAVVSLALLCYGTCRGIDVKYVDHLLSISLGYLLGGGFSLKNKTS